MMLCTIIGNLMLAAGALMLLTTAGNRACRLLFAATGMAKNNSQPDSPAAAGWAIGGLERTIFAIGIIVSSWEVLAVVIALKSVARYKELDEKLPADYFLVGSMFSIIWAAIVTTAWMMVDRRYGAGISGILATFLNPSAA